MERQLDENGDPVGLASKIFDNADFGYFKVTVRRPDRRKAQFSAERIEPLRFDKSPVKRWNIATTNKKRSIKRVSWRNGKTHHRLV